MQPAEWWPLWMGELRRSLLSEKQEGKSLAKIGSVLQQKRNRWLHLWYFSHWPRYEYFLVASTFRNIQKCHFFRTTHLTCSVALNCYNVTNATHAAYTTHVMRNNKTNKRNNYHIKKRTHVFRRSCFDRLPSYFKEEKLFGLLLFWFDMGT